MPLANPTPFTTALPRFIITVQLLAFTRWITLLLVHVGRQLPRLPGYVPVLDLLIWLLLPLPLVVGPGIYHYGYGYCVRTF